MEKESKVDMKALKANVKKAKDAANKSIKTADDAKNFVEKNKEKIEFVSKKLKGKDKENFDKIVSALSDAKLNESEAAVKTICGLTAVVAWLLGFPTTAIVAASPIYSQVLSGVVGKLTNLKESTTIHDDQISDETKLELNVPGTDGAEIEIEGDWDAVRFAVDLLTDAVSHMKAKDPMQYSGVELRAKHK